MSEDYVKSSKPELRRVEVGVLKKEVEKESWISLRQYFHGSGNGPEAKIACVVVTTLAREKQAENNKRQLDLVFQRMGLLEDKK